MKLTITHATTIVPTGHFIQWALDSATDVATTTFAVDRSGGPNGPWTPVLAPTAGQYAVLDDFSQIRNTPLNNAPTLLQVYDRYYYRVTCTPAGGVPLTDLIETGPQTNSTPRAGRMAQELKRLRYNFERTLEGNGTPVVLLKRRTWGVKCKRCYDPRTKQIMRSDCRDCWGTAYIGGYWLPWYTLARRNATSNTTGISPEGKSDTSDAKFWLKVWPQLERDDVLVVLADGRRYRVDQQIQPEIRLQGTHQVLSTQELAHDHVIYHYKLEPRTLNPLT